MGVVWVEFLPSLSGFLWVHIVSARFPNPSQKQCSTVLDRSKNIEACSKWRRCAFCTLVSQSTARMAMICCTRGLAALVLQVRLPESREECGLNPTFVLHSLQVTFFLIHSSSTVSGFHERCLDRCILQFYTY